MQTFTTQGRRGVDQDHLAAQVGSPKSRRIAAGSAANDHDLRVAFDLTHHHSCVLSEASGI
jgi:hypothetical protein